MSGPHHIAVPAGKVIPHHLATFSDVVVPAGEVRPPDPTTLADAAEPVAPQNTVDPLAMLVAQVNDVLTAAGLPRSVGPAEEVLAVLPLAEGTDVAAVLAALRAAPDADLARAAAWPPEGEPGPVDPFEPVDASSFGGTGIIAVALGKVVPH